MNIIGTEENKFKKYIKKNKTNIAIVIIAVLSIIFIIVGVFLYKNKGTKDIIIADKVEKDANEILTDEIKNKYKDLGLNIDSDIKEIKKDNDISSKNIDENIDIINIGNIDPDGIQAIKYKDFNIDDLSESIDSESKYRSEIEGKKNADSKSLDVLIATSKIEINNTLGIIKHTIEDNTNDRENNFDNNLLYDTLNAKSNGTTGDRTEIDDQTYGQTLNIVQNWLFYNFNKSFNWRMITESPNIYKNIIANKEYNNKFKDIRNTKIIMEKGIRKIDIEYVSYDMIFTNKGSAYRAIFAIEDNMPRLLDMDKI